MSCTRHCSVLYQEGHLVPVGPNRPVQAPDFPCQRFESSQEVSYLVTKSAFGENDELVVEEGALPPVHSRRDYIGFFNRLDFHHKSPDSGEGQTKIRTGKRRFYPGDLPRGPTSKRRGNNVKRLKDFYLEVKSRIWP